MPEITLANTARALFYFSIFAFLLGCVVEYAIYQALVRFEMNKWKIQSARERLHDWETKQEATAHSVLTDSRRS